MYVQILRTFCYLLLSLAPCCSFALTAEQVLGEYWKDPLFGEAATEETVLLEVLDRKIWPEVISVPKGKNVRFVVLNKTDDRHLIAFSDDMDNLLADEDFQIFANDEIFHSRQKRSDGRGHSHAGSSVDEAEAIVKTMSQRLTVFVIPYSQKEILIRFDKEAQLKVFCALDKHHQTGYVSELVVESSEN